MLLLPEISTMWNTPRIQSSDSWFLCNAQGFPLKCFPRLLPGAIKKSMTGVIKIWQCGLSRTSPNLPIIRRLKSSKRALGYNFEVPKQNWLWDFLLKRDARLRKLNHQDTETQRRLI